LSKEMFMIKTTVVGSGKSVAGMGNAVFRGVAAYCPSGACRFLASLLLAISAMAFLFSRPICVAQDSKTPAVLPAPSSGKAIVCIYRTYRFTGSSSHDELYINGTHLAKLLNSEYAFMEVPAGTVVISGLPKEYYGSIIMSAAAAANQARQKENERARFEAEAGKTYYFKWTAGAFATGIKVTAEDPGVGAKEIRKLHLSKPVDDKAEAKPEESAKPAGPPDASSDQPGKPR
jgi:hypothetical protein